jgi:hypothetical protein
MRHQQEVDAVAATAGQPAGNVVPGTSDQPTGNAVNRGPPPAAQAPPQQQQDNEPCDTAYVP